MRRHLLVVLRTCSTVNMINDTGAGRYIKTPKHDLVNHCVSSLVNSINQVEDYDIELVVLDDHSTAEAVSDIKTILSNCKSPTEFIAVESGTGNGYTMGRVYELVEQRCRDLWYHVEDDYLHMPEAIQDMLYSVETFEAQTGKMVAVNPHDDVWRYTNNPYPSYLLLGPYRHYRTVKHTTYTCLASRAIYDKYREHFQNVVTLTTARADWVEDKSINMVWNQPDVLLFSPIPGLAFHIMDESGKDRYIDVGYYWDTTPKLWLGTGTSGNVAIVTIFNEKHQDLADITWNNKLDYAAKHGYKAFAKTDNFSPEQVHFDKFIHILDTLDKNPDVEWVWWLDNDALITNFDIKIEDIADPDYHVIMGPDIASLNSGSFIVRNSLQSREWLKFLLSKKKEYRNDTKWFEQQAIIDFYPKFQDIFKIVPQKTFNSYDYRIYNVDSTDLTGNSGQWQEGDFVIHWPSLQNSVRIQLANQYKPLIKNTP